MEKKFKIDHLIPIIERYAFDDAQMALEILWHLGLLNEERIIPRATWISEYLAMNKSKEEASQPSASNEELQRTLDI